MTIEREEEQRAGRPDFVTAGVVAQTGFQAILNVEQRPWWATDRRSCE